MDLWEKFVELEKRHFAFLEFDFQFERKEEKHPWVRYESGLMNVGIYYGEWRHELDFAISRRSYSLQKCPAIGSGVLLNLYNWREAEKYLSPCPKTEESLEIEVPRLAAILKKYGSKILKGDSNEFARIERLNLEAAEQINKQTELNLPKNRIKKQ